MRETLGYSCEDYGRFRGYAWRYLILFSLLYCALYCARLNLANASASLITELSFTKADIGILTGALFWGYGFGQLVNGRASEVVGAKKFLIASVLLTFTMNMAMSLTTTLWLMGFVWGINGFVQSMAWTPGISMLTNWWPSRRRGFAVGFAVAFSGFGQVAATLSVALAFLLFPTGGSKVAFLLPASLPLALLVFFLLFTREKPEAIGLKPYVEANSKKAEEEAAMRKILEEKGVLYPYRFVFASKGFLLWIFIAFAMGLSRYGLITWVPLFMIDRFETTLSTGLLQSVALPIGMGVGTLLVPTLTDRFCPHNRMPGVVLSAAAAAFSLLLLLAFPEKNDLFAVEVLLFLAGFFIYAAIGTAWTYATDLGGRVFSATALGTLDFAQYMGAASQSLLFGAMLEHFGWSLVFTAIAVVCALCALFGALFARPGKKARF